MALTARKNCQVQATQSDYEPRGNNWHEDKQIYCVPILHERGS